MYSVCLFENGRLFQGAKYLQYPLDGLAICKEIIRNTRISEQLYIKRDGDKLHYIYTLGLDDGNIIGLYFDSIYLCNDINDLLDTFRFLIDELAVNKLGISKNGKKKIAATDSFAKRKVDFDIFFSENKISFRGTPLPIDNIRIPKTDIVRCIYSVKGSNWILSQIKNGYHQIEITFKDTPIVRNISLSKSSFYWGGRTWIFFMSLISILLVILYIIYNDSILKAHFKYGIENLIR